MRSPTKAPELTAKQRRFLRAMAHALRPVVLVGQAGLSDAVMAELDQALSDHELVKVRLHSPDDKKMAAAALAERAGAALCGVVGHTVYLYRPNPDQPKIQISA